MAAVVISGPVCSRVAGAVARDPGAAERAGAPGSFARVLRDDGRRLDRRIRPAAVEEAVKQRAGGLFVRGETGATLVEILVALAIIASTLTIFVIALSTGAFGVRTAERLTTANNLAASQLESIKGATYDAAGAYVPIPALPGYAVAVTSREIVTGLQQITVTVSLQGETLSTVSNYKVNR